MNQESLIVLQPTILMNKESILAEHLAVAGVACKQCYCECPVTTQIVTLRPTQQAQLDSDNSQQLTITTILLTGLAAIFGTVSVTLATLSEIGKKH